MAANTFRRVLGETSLERKTRFRFLFALGGIIIAAFFGVDRIAENLVIDQTRVLAKQWTATLFARLHMKDMADHIRKNPALGSSADMYADMSQETTDTGVKYALVDLDTSNPVDDLGAQQGRGVVLPQDEAERQLIAELKQLQVQFLADLQAYNLQKEAHEATIPTVTETAVELPAPPTPPFLERSAADANSYYYYTPFPNHKRLCVSCHKTTRSNVGITSSLDPGLHGPSDLDAYPVIKVIVPYERTRTAIATVRAVLGSGAIGTIFVAMVLLYFIFSHLVVKPLNHLREVSDEISRGSTDLRADINTNDEFEELAASFNRMLHHLTDAQEELQLANDDLDGKIDELAQANMRLYEMNRLKSDFMANMSHELRTPLNSIIGFSEVLQGIEALNDKQKRYAGNIQNSGRVLLEMINDILDLAKVEAGKMEVKPSEFDIRMVVQAQCDMVRKLAEDKNIDVDVFVPPESETIYQDQTKIQQILTNLLSNAIKFTPEGGRITVSAIQNTSGFLDLSVADTGVGIAEADQELVFEKFRQGQTVLGDDNLTREYSGTGLGLSIVKELCKLLGGEVTLSSQVGKGSVFSVVLPWTLSNMPGRELDMNIQMGAISTANATSAKPDAQISDTQTSDGSTPKTPTPKTQPPVAPISDKSDSQHSSQPRDVTSTSADPTPSKTVNDDDLKETA